MAKPKPEFPFHFIKTASYRTYYVDGAFGGVTPNGTIYAELFLERGTTPSLVTYQVSDDKKTLEEKSREGKTGYVREIECGLIMDLRTAIAFRAWLDTRIKEAERRMNLQDDKNDKETSDDTTP